MFGFNFHLLPPRSNRCCTWVTEPVSGPACTADMGLFGGGITNNLRIKELLMSRVWKCSSCGTNSRTGKAFGAAEWQLNTSTGWMECRTGSHTELWVGSTIVIETRVGEGIRALWKSDLRRSPLAPLYPNKPALWCNAAWNLSSFCWIDVPRLIVWKSSCTPTRKSWKSFIITPT